MNNNVSKFLKSKNHRKKKKVLSFFNKTLICFIMVIVCLILMKTNKEFKEFVNKNILKDNISFAYINNLYNKYFGNILPSYKSDGTSSVFNEKLEYKSYNTYYDGYKLEVDNSYLVPSIESGIVVFIGDVDNYGNVLIIEGVDGVDIWYGNIKNVGVKLYDYVDAKTYLGETVDNTLYLVFERNHEYLKFEDYIKN